MRLATAVILLALAGCATTQDASRLWNDIYVGNHVDHFFRANGPAAQQQKLGSGETIYVWTSRSLMTTANLQAGAPYCELRILVDSNGIVKQIQPTADTLGV